MEIAIILSALALIRTFSFGRNTPVKRHELEKFADELGYELTFWDTLNLTVHKKWSSSLTSTNDDDKFITQKQLKDIFESLNKRIEFYNTIKAVGVYELNYNKKDKIDILLDYLGLRIKHVNEHDEIIDLKKE